MSHKSLEDIPEEAVVELSGLIRHFAPRVAESELASACLIRKVWEMSGPHPLYVDVQTIELLTKIELNYQEARAIRMKPRGFRAGEIG